MKLGRRDRQRYLCCFVRKRFMGYDNGQASRMPLILLLAMPYILDRCHAIFAIQHSIRGKAIGRSSLRL